MPDSQPRVGLFVTCLVDLFRPSVGFAAVRLLEAAGCRVEVPELQSCCGQPAYNSGDKSGAAVLARQVIAAFAAFDYVVAPSGSCAAMVKLHYPALFAGDPKMRAEAEALAARTHELLSFLVDVRGMRDTGASLAAAATYHDSCSGLRELGIKAQPRALMSSVKGLELTEMENGEACCGFGGTFCVKYADISNAIVSEKTKEIAASGAETLLAGDMGCLMNMAGKLQREKRPVSVRHVAEVLADMTGDVPPIGETTSD